ncbi:MAG TPA: TPM domain-containing protein [Ignavibacteria bacterium]
MKNWIYNYFSEDGLKDIQRKVGKVESQTVGEIVLSFRRKRSWLEKLYLPHELAMKDFDKMKVWNTKEGTGVLVFIIFEEKYYDIIADEGIYAKIPDEIWNTLEDELKERFKAGNYLAGILQLIDKMSDVLCKEFPTRAGVDNDDELPDEIWIK